MTEEDIVSLIEKAIKHRSETNNVEFKDGRGGFGRKVWKTISSFSHSTEGGIIVYGVEDNSETGGEIKVVGRLDVAILQEKIISFFAEKMINVNPPDIRLISFNGETLIVVIVSPINSENKPCYYKDEGLPQGACIRIGNSDRSIDMEQLKTFLRDSIPFKFDKTEAKDTSIDMLSDDKIKEFLDNSSSRVGRTQESTGSQEVLYNLGLVDEFDLGFRPTVAGFLIFSKDEPQKNPNFSRYVIRCVRYAGNTVSSPIVDKEDVVGTLDEQITKSHHFIMRNIPISATLVGTRRVETYSYPEEAIREVVANAIVHRDYQITETYTQINIFSNRVEITNAGNLPPGINIENIKDAQFSRNEIIATTLKDMNYMEEYGRGINLVYSKMKEWNLLEPLFKNKANSFSVILLGEQFKELNSSQIIIWNFIQREGSATALKCVELLGSRSRQSVNIDLRGLVEKELIKKEGSGSNIYYVPVY